MGKTKRGSFPATAVLAATMVLGGGSASAGPINIYLDETQHIWAYTTNPGGLTVIENPGLLVLCESGVTLSHPGCDSHGISDIVWFAEVTNVLQQYYFYSDNSDVDSSAFAADTVLPDPATSLFTLQNVLDYATGPLVGVPAVFFVESGTEGGWNGLGYTPSSNLPGYFSFNGDTPTYLITSDPAPVPEPATLALLGLGLAGLGFSRKRAS